MKPIRSRAGEHGWARYPLPLGLALSAVLHAALLLGIRFHMKPDPGGGPAAGRGVAPTMVGMRGLNLVLATDATRAAAPAAAVRDEPEPALATSSSRIFTLDRLADPGTDRWAPTRNGGARRVGPPGGLLRSRNVFLLPPRDPLSTVRAGLAHRIDSFNDSVAAARDAERHITDWTHRSRDGSRWGASPGALHLGGLTLHYCGGGFSPLDCGVGVPAARLPEYKARVQGFRQTRAQASRAALDEALRDRIEAIRRRLEARRDSLRRVGGEAHPSGHQ